MPKSLRVLLTAVLLCLPVQAFAACSSPSGAEGHVRYNKPDKKLYFCDGTNWIAPGGGTSTGTGNWDIVGQPIKGANGGSTVILCKGVIGSDCGGGIFAGDGNIVLSPAGCNQAGVCTGNGSDDRQTALFDTDNPDGTIIAQWETGRWRYGYAQTEFLATNWPSRAYAHKWCMDFNYGGYSDWYMPSTYEMRVIMDNYYELYTYGPASVSGIATAYPYRFSFGANYWGGSLLRDTSIQLNRAMGNYFVPRYGGINGAYIGSNIMRIRCIRRN